LLLNCGASSTLRSLGLRRPLSSSSSSQHAARSGGSGGGGGSDGNGAADTANAALWAEFERRRREDRQQRGRFVGDVQLILAEVRKQRDGAAKGGSAAKDLGLDSPMPSAQGPRPAGGGAGVRLEEQRRWGAAAQVPPCRARSPQGRQLVPQPSRMAQPSSFPSRAPPAGPSLRRQLRPSPPVSARSPGQPPAAARRAPVQTRMRPSGPPSKSLGEAYKARPTAISRRCQPALASGCRAEKEPWKLTTSHDLLVDLGHKYLGQPLHKLHAQFTLGASNGKLVESRGSAVWPRGGCSGVSADAQQQSPEHPWTSGWESTTEGTASMFTTPVTSRCSMRGTPPYCTPPVPARSRIGGAAPLCTTPSPSRRGFAAAAAAAQCTPSAPSGRRLGGAGPHGVTPVPSSSGIGWTASHRSTPAPSACRERPSVLAAAVVEYSLAEADSPRAVGTTELEQIYEELDWSAPCGTRALSGQSGDGGAAASASHSAPSAVPEGAAPSPTSRGLAPSPSSRADDGRSLQERHGGEALHGAEFAAS